MGRLLKIQAAEAGEGMEKYPILSSCWKINSCQGAENASDLTDLTIVYVFGPSLYSASNVISVEARSGG
jgi:hypothetical protein